MRRRRYRRKQGGVPLIQTKTQALLLGVAIGHLFSATGRAGVVEAIADAIERIKRDEAPAK